MGVPKFFRYISERYPCLSELVEEFQIPDFDNLYLDMNGIIHSCSHPNDFEPYFTITEEKIIANIFHYIEVLFNMIKPRKLFFMAVDGVAPRAKMNHQRARRFRSAKEAEDKEKEALRNGKPLPKERYALSDFLTGDSQLKDRYVFDSNCITPGTVFMDHLHSQLKYFVTSKVSTDPLWQGCKIILSGHQTPGEGEHKIMDYIRYLKTLPDYDENTRHCLYGLDADLIMLGLCTHEPHFSLLREKVRFSKQQSKRITSPDETEFYLLHLSLLREYLDLEFQELKTTLPFQYNVENIIDDWVLMGFLVGNDFIPNLPDFHINKEAFPMLYKLYKEVMPTLDGYLNENGYLNLPRFEQFMEKMAKFDLQAFEDTYAGLAFLEEKTGRSFMPGKEANGVSGRKTELEELIKATEEFELSEDDISDEQNDIEDNETFLWEFSQHKKNYYTAKLEYEQVTSEVLKSQAECYIRAIQWNLHYYYHGCQSWSWYYPHHYAPYVSDIKNFKDLKLDFDMGKPFLPFEQLLAVLPAASKNLLPVAYHDLMTSGTSPIKDFYPDSFETDLNGKQHDWEAVVLIPFIDEGRLLKAMEGPNKRLSSEELRRNQHGPMHVYTYTKEDLGRYESVKYFPTIPVNHAALENVSREKIMVEISKLKYGLRPGVLLGVLYPGFPTLKHIPFTASLALSKVKVFENPSRGHNMTLIVSEREFPPLAALADDILGKTVYVNWPHLVESRAIGISDGKTKYTLTEYGTSKCESLDKAGHTEWSNDAQNVSRKYMQNLGINIGPVKVIVYSLNLEGRKYVFGPRGKITNENAWSTTATPCPIQVLVKDVPVQDHRTQAYTDFKDAFPVNSVVFMLGQPHFGSMGRILDSTECVQNGRLKVSFETINEALIDEAVLMSQQKTTYLPRRVAALKVGVNPNLFSRITGVLLVSMTKEDNGDPGSKINIGLNMKFCKKNEELSGYTKKDNENWLYSQAAIDIVSKYVEKFARVVEYLSNNQNKVFFVQDIFPGPDGVTEMKEMVAWIKEQGHTKVERLKCGTEVLDTETIAKLEELVEKMPREVIERQMQIKPHLLYKSDLVFGNVPPVKSAHHRLLDRVVSIRSSYTVPTGFRGFIIGIHPAILEADYLYDVLFDQPFLGGTKLNSSEKVFRMCRASFLNISDADRQSGKAKPNLPLSGGISIRPPTTQTQTSAFAKWTQPPPSSSAKTDDNFKELWTNLQRAKPQEEALKKILKIEKKETNDIEAPVKSFFENIKSKCPLVPETVPVTPFIESGVPKYKHQLLSLFQQLRVGHPNFKYLKADGKVMAQVLLSDGRVYLGLPCDDKESAVESACFQALYSLRAIPLINETLLEREKKMQIQGRLQQPKQRGAGQKGMYNNKIPNAQPNNRINLPPNNRMPVVPQGNYRMPQPTYRVPNPQLYNSRMPHVLPSPPSQWVLGRPQRPDHNYSHQRDNFHPRPRHEVMQTTQITPHSENSKPNVSALEFVPLQAIKGKRNVKKAPPPRNPPPPSECQKKTEVVATFFNVTGNSSSTSKPKRRSKIAAKLDFDPNLH